MKIIKNILFIVMFISIANIIGCQKELNKESVKKNNIDQIINQDIVDKISVYNIDISEEFSADEDIKIIIQDINKCISKNKNSIGILDGSILISDNFEKTLVPEDDNYIVKVQFKNKENLNLNNLDITCKNIILDTKKSIIYYWDDENKEAHMLGISKDCFNNIKKTLNVLLTN